MGCIISTCQSDGTWVTVDTRTPEDLIANREYDAERFDVLGDRGAAWLTRNPGHVLATANPPEARALFALALTAQSARYGMNPLPRFGSRLDQAFRTASPFTAEDLEAAIEAQAFERREP